MAAERARLIRCVGGVVHDAAGRLLLVRRANPPGEGRWSIPGGRVEPGEGDHAAVVREIREETGLVVTVGELVGQVTRPAADGLYDIHDYACQVRSGVLRPGDDASEVRWATTAILATLDLADGLYEALREWGRLPRA
ncbi:NUDIX hydrolase [Saccharothrix obliqua]|uniref:NUDIX hydrolase n=1 Tax=Saccharothrix obliqua TaxID=2861747 RepID=UPI001C5CCDDA|nr:NUDIX domain-containing protein [Saccharothrix obliqua]MBW4719308.1 NUDIX domain-containing protein [Saccharothrix obliqua]